MESLPEGWEGGETVESRTHPVIAQWVDDRMACRPSSWAHMGQGASSSPAGAFSIWMRVES
jgi:hypothetical protein